MAKLCERPGCSENAALAYGMRTEDLVFWLDELRDSTDHAGGVLCQRHGDSMIVPRGWTLDDLRDPDLHLFRPPTVAELPRPATSRRTRGVGAGDDTQQLELGGLGVAEQPAVDTTATTITAAGESDATDDVDTPEQWSPRFDAADDLDGLLSASSPLLSRAFRGADRPD
ncbi:hypothetical protein [Ilumatobacter nonamiensis]|uniref:hypothetical protein n=1 Tax=Ilumatobacter nonamiensis TaxID=467093 RepID=UPI00034B4884|nr:hypothetical protein [Ilumatobacter nonamiensis]